MILPAAGASLLTLVLVISVCIQIMQREKTDDSKDHESDEIQKRVSEIPKRFSYRELSVETSKFSEKLGKGGFGTVFKGFLKDGTLVAVKQIHRSGQATKEFIADVQTIGHIHHINLVRLIGICTSRRHRMLVN